MSDKMPSFSTIAAEYGVRVWPREQDWRPGLALSVSETGMGPICARRDMIICRAQPRAGFSDHVVMAQTALHCGTAPFPRRVERVNPA